MGKTFVPELFEILLEFTKSRRRKVKNNEKSKKKGKKVKGRKEAVAQAVRQCSVRPAILWAYAAMTPGAGGHRDRTRRTAQSTTAEPTRIPGGRRAGRLSQP